MSIRFLSRNTLLFNIAQFATISLQCLKLTLVVQWFRRNTFPCLEDNCELDEFPGMWYSSQCWDHKIKLLYLLKNSAKHKCFSLLMLYAIVHTDLLGAEEKHHQVLGKVTILIYTYTTTFSSQLTTERAQYWSASSSAPHSTWWTTTGWYCGCRIVSDWLVLQLRGSSPTCRTESSSSRSETTLWEQLGWNREFLKFGIRTVPFFYPRVTSFQDHSGHGRILPVCGRHAAVLLHLHIRVHIWSYSTPGLCAWCIGLVPNELHATKWWQIRSQAIRTWRTGSQGRS